MKHRNSLLRTYLHETPKVYLLTVTNDLGAALRERKEVSGRQKLQDLRVTRIQAMTRVAHLCVRGRWNGRRPAPLLRRERSWL
ncbi:MAG TPA: hypothetical protein VEQ11_07500 [Chloroflexota bacterium]|nr:hypothetical protein [Chloroflexota bacterium]